MNLRQMFCKHSYSAEGLVCMVGAKNVRYMNKCVLCGHEYSVKLPKEAIFGAMEKIVYENATV